LIRIQNLKRGAIRYKQGLSVCLSLYDASFFYWCVNFGSILIIINSHLLVYLYLCKSWTNFVNRNYFD